MRAAWRTLELIAGAVVAIVGIPAAVSARSVQVNEPGVCFDCHAEIQAQTTAPHVHAAFASGACSSCHNPHASRHAGLLGEAEGELCLSCHDEVARELEAPSAHEPAASGNCVKCHEPHASSNRTLLTAPLRPLCAGCHTEVDEWATSAVIHAPVDQDDCLTCHTPHGSADGRLLRAAVPALCFDCHEADAAFAAAHGSDAVASSDCTACHDPHAGPVPGLVRANQHAPFASGSCSTCHGGDENRTSFAITGNILTLCTKCHRSVREAASSTYTHNLTDERSCKNCHNPHASNTGHLLLARQERLCMRCHFQESEIEEGRTREEYITHPGVACSECHTPHGSNNPRYLRTLDVELCARCHERAHRTSHPVGEKVIDPRNGESLTCLSCHRLHGAPFEDYLPLDPSMDLCIQCHQR